MPWRKPPLSSTTGSVASSGTSKKLFRGMSAATVSPSILEPLWMQPVGWHYVLIYSRGVRYDRLYVWPLWACRKTACWTAQDRNETSKDRAPTGRFMDQERKCNSEVWKLVRATPRPKKNPWARKDIVQFSKNWTMINDPRSLFKVGCIASAVTHCGGCEPCRGCLGGLRWHQASCKPPQSTGSTSGTGAESDPCHHLSKASPRPVATPSRWP